MAANRNLRKELKSLGVKSKDMKRLLHSFKIIEIVAFDINKNITEMFSVYELSRLSE